jgi:hypothetical protein
VIPIVSVVAIAAVAAIATGRTFRGFPAVQLGWAWLAFVGFALQVIPLSGELGLAALLLSFGLLLAFALRNVTSPGFVLLSLGLLLNLAVIGMNGGMPVTRAALADSGQLDTIADLERGGGNKHHLEDERSVLLPLADAIGLPDPIGQAVSVGDLLMYAGIGWFTYAATRRRDAERARPPDAFAA